MTCVPSLDDSDANFCVLYGTVSLRGHAQIDGLVQERCNSSALALTPVH